MFIDTPGMQEWVSALEVRHPGLRFICEKILQEQPEISADDLKALAQKEWVLRNSPHEEESE